MVSELLWLLEGSTDERRLCEILHGTRDISKNTIWTANANAQGKALGYTNTDDVKELGPVYGAQWRGTHSTDAVDQISQIINQINTTPDSRRIILSSWNVDQIDQMALPPCHTMVQFYVQEGKLSTQLYQRSADLFLGIPFNIASYTLLTHMIASITGLEVGEFIHSIGDMHIYLDHMDQVKEQLTRTPAKMPTLEMPTFTSLDDVLKSKLSDYSLIDYNPQASIKANMSV